MATRPVGREPSADPGVARQAIRGRAQDEDDSQHSIEVNTLLRLQRLVGNAAVSAYLHGSGTGHLPAGTSPLPVQRDGQHASLAVPEPYVAEDHGTWIDLVSPRHPDIGLRVLTPTPVERRRFAYDVAYGPEDPIHMRPILRVVKMTGVDVVLFGVLSGVVPFRYELYEVDDPTDVPSQGTSLSPVGRRVNPGAVPFGDPERALATTALAATAAGAVVATGVLLPAVAGAMVAAGEAAVPVVVGESRLFLMAAQRMLVWVVTNPSRAMVVADVAANTTFQVIESGGITPWLRYRFGTPEGLSQTAIDYIFFRYDMAGASSGAGGSVQEVPVEIEHVEPGRAMLRTMAPAVLPVESQGGASGARPGVRAIGSLAGSLRAAEAANDDALHGPGPAAPARRAAAAGDHGSADEAAPARGPGRAPALVRGARVEGQRDPPSASSAGGGSTRRPPDAGTVIGSTATPAASSGTRSGIGGPSPRWRGAFDRTRFGDDPAYPTSYNTARWSKRWREWRNRPAETLQDYRREWVNGMRLRSKSISEVLERIVRAGGSPLYPRVWTLLNQAYGRNVVRDALMTGGFLPRRR